MITYRFQRRKIGIEFDVKYESMTICSELLLHELILRAIYAQGWTILHD